MDHLELLLSFYKGKKQLDIFNTRTIYRARDTEIFIDGIENFKRIYIIVIPSDFRNINYDNFNTIFDINKFNLDKIQSQILMLENVSISESDDINIYNILKTYKGAY